MAFDPYKSAKAFFKPGAAPAYPFTEEDKTRVQSYEFYENVFWNMPETFQVLARGQNSAPIYLPSARKIVEACNRFLAVGFNYAMSSPNTEVETLLLSLFKREKFFTKFATQKRYGLIRGDALWHIVGDATKEEGKRVSIYELSPANYFPITDPDDPEKTIGCHLVDLIQDPGDENKKVIVRRQTYRKENGKISSELTHWEVDGWDDRNIKAADLKFIRTVVKPFFLPDSITSLPVYKVPNNRIPGPSPFSYSELMGVERIFAAVNQAVSDEELALAMAGLGVFWTTSGPPKDTAGNIVPWDIGPAQMLEVGKDATINRLQGISSVQPMIDHMEFILGQAQSGLSVPDIAAGKVDVAVAESGIALQLQLSPLLAHNAEKELGIIEEYDQMFFDLATMWFPAYEAVTANPQAVPQATTGDPMPSNRAADIGEVMDLVAAGILSKVEARTILKNRFGYKITPAIDKLLEEKSAQATAEDPFSVRATNELNSNPDNGQVDPTTQDNGQGTTQGATQGATA
jgi:hypothetical protein